MIPRADIIAIRAAVTLSQAIEQMRIERHSWGLSCSGHDVEPNMMPYIPECPRKCSSSRASPRMAMRSIASMKSRLRTTGSTTTAPA